MENPRMIFFILFYNKLVYITSLLNKKREISTVLLTGMVQVVFFWFFYLNVTKIISDHINFSCISFVDAKYSLR